MMRIVDLTHTISSDMMVYPGTGQPALEKANTMEDNGFRETRINIYSHVGTHIDAPAHMLEEGSYLSGFEAENFIGRAMILDFTDTDKKKIEVDDIKPYEDKIALARFVIIKTGWSNYWGRIKYLRGFPTLSGEAAEWLSRFKLKGIGIDAISIDDMGSSSFEIHKILLKNNIIIVENITNLDSIKDETFILSVLPLKYETADGSPVRAVAIEGIIEN